jgi:hypothetical protein
MEEDAATNGQRLMMQDARNSWKTLALVLALILGAVLICAALVATGVMKLGLSLL